ncbi:glycogen debranching N-terminal domain-containing protein [Caulobacter segnis]
MAHDNVFFTCNSTNQALPYPGGPMGPPGVLHIERKRFLWGERLYERIRCVNYSRDTVMLPMAIEFDADFRDMFEVRGTHRAKRGVKGPPYIDGASRRPTAISAWTASSAPRTSPSPTRRIRLGAHKAEFMFSLQAEGETEPYIEIGVTDGHTPSRERFRDAAARARWDMRSRRRHGARLNSSGRLFNEWLGKSRSDLALLTTRMETGPIHTPAFRGSRPPSDATRSSPLGKACGSKPSLARGVLRYLAAHQAEERSTFRDSAPGKIMHETRKGEMPALGEVPFARYYGGVDTTPLFVALAGRLPGPHR